jgi:hypothetical protein
VINFTSCEFVCFSYQVAFLITTVTIYLFESITVTVWANHELQSFLGKQGKYLEAQEVKRIADRMEHMELQATLAGYQSEVTSKEQALRQKQQAEMEVLLQRATQGRDELQKTRVQDLDRCNQVC